MPRSPLLRRLLVALLSCLLTLTVLELGARLLVKPSAISYGRLGDTELSPLRLQFDSQAVLTSHANEPLKHTRAGFEHITQADMAGFYQDDRELGWVPTPGRRSRNGWWTSNNVGARERQASAPRTAAGLRRVLLMGESFTSCLGVPQEQSWPELLDRAAPDTEFVNLGVAGYGTAQSALYYERMAAKLAHDAVLLALVPSVDLWRDINVSRFVAFRWAVFNSPAPRYSLRDGVLTLLPFPWQDMARFYALSDAQKLRQSAAHLRAHDRYYIPGEYEGVAVLSQLVLGKYALGAWANRRRRVLDERSMEPDSEAMQVTRAIVTGMASDAAAAGHQFALLLLPTHDKLQRCTAPQATDCQAWQQMKEVLCAAVSCVDGLSLMAPLKQGDAGLDDKHYGPRSNAALAEALLPELRRTGFVGPAAEAVP